MKYLILAGILTVGIFLPGCEQAPTKPAITYGYNFIKPGGSMGSTATFTTTVNNSFQAATTIAFTNAITYGSSPSTPIFAANTFYICATGGGGTGLNFAVGSNVIGVDGNLNVPTGTMVYNASVTYQVQL